MRYYIFFPTVFLVFFFTSIVLAAEGNSLFWQLEDQQGKKHYIFGTIHTDDNRVSNFDPSVMNAIKEVDIFLSEVDEVTNPSVLQLEQEVYPDYLTEIELDKIKLLAEYHTIPEYLAFKMKPWLLAVILNSPRPITPFNQDNLLKTQARDFLKQTKGIESIKQHFNTLDSFTIKQQMSILKNVLALSEKNRINNYELLISAYLSSSPKKILEADLKVTKLIVPNELWGKFKTKFLINRNNFFVTKIIEYTKDNKLFIAVGASHLGGKSGLLNQLKKNGFKVSPMNALIVD